MTILYLILGVVLLIAGRKLYWFFTAAVGMVGGIYLGGVVLEAQNEGWQIAFAVIGAILGAILAVALQKLAIAVAGFLAGGFGAIFLWQALGFSSGNIEWVPFIIGGIIGTVLVAIAFEYGLIALTAWAGATLISQQLDIGGWVGVAAFTGLLIAGAVIQTVGLLSERKGRPPAESPQEQEAK